MQNALSVDNQGIFMPSARDSALWMKGMSTDKGNMVVLSALLHILPVVC